MNKINKDNLIKIFILSLFCLSLLQSDDTNYNKLPNDIRWVVKSDEYKLLCTQIYQEAASILESIISNDKSRNSSTIIIDLDETVLDNSQYQIENFNLGKTFNMESWAKWVNRSEATLVPGVSGFINFIRKKEIQIIFISNRMNERLDATIKNLKNLNIYSDDDIFLLRLDKSDKKHVRRSEINLGINRMSAYGSFDIIMSVGDAMGDFDLDNKLIKNIILPNPMYGKW